MNRAVACVHSPDWSVAMTMTKYVAPSLSDKPSTATNVSLAALVRGLTSRRAAIAVGFSVALDDFCTETRGGNVRRTLTEGTTSVYCE